MTNLKYAWSNRGGVHGTPLDATGEISPFAAQDMVLNWRVARKMVRTKFDAAMVTSNLRSQF
jgi:hypothetical protein